MRLYESCRSSIRVAFFGFVLISIGTFIQNSNVNLFYTFKSSVVLFLAEFFLRLGEFIVMNLPLIFMLNGVCKKANNASPVVMALVGYFTFSVTTMLFASQTLDSSAYISGYGINSVFNISTGTRMPLQTGMFGSLLVAIGTRLAFVFSRHRGNYSLTNLFSKDIAGIIYAVLLCFGFGILTSYAYPFLYSYIQKAISFIAEDIMDPFRIAMYSMLDRVLSILGLDSLIRKPFWYTSLGGSFQNTTTGQSVLGDVNIWSYVMKQNVASTSAGKFITPYYVINMFIIPAFYLGTLMSMTDKKNRLEMLGLFIAGIVFSIAMGNPLPVEFLMLFTSPFITLAYILLVGGVSYSLIIKQAYLGFETSSLNTTVAMPGSFPDFIINVRNANLSNTLLTIVIIGAIAFMVMLLITIVYYRFIAFDFARSGNGDKTISNVINSVGGFDNIIKTSSGLLKLNVYLKNPELISIEKIQEVGPRRVSETRDGIVFEFGTSSYAISKRINKLIKIDK